MGLPVGNSMLEMNTQNLLREEAEDTKFRRFWTLNIRTGS